jgi:ATP-binding cassette subfamily F protein uup
MYPRDHLNSPGGYADYLEYREQMVAELNQQKRSLANKVRREVEWLRQGVKARTTKSKARISEAHRLIDTLAATPATERRAIELSFSATERRTKELLKAHKIAQSMGGRKLFSGVSLVLSPGTRLAVVGPNGSGKTTFVKTLLGLIPPQTGTISQATNVRVAFLDQVRSALAEDISLKEFLAPHSDSVMFQGAPVHVAAWASRFLFSHNHLSRSLSKLSGGERARAILAKSISQEADILVFDEPTNDLDIATLENLEQGFESFPGAIVLITHDRYLLDRTASSVLGLSNGEATIFGSYQLWDEHKRQIQHSLVPTRNAASKDTKSETQPRQLKKLSYKDARELSMIEETIAVAEEKLDTIRRDLDSGEHASNAQKLSELCSTLSQQEAEVDRLYRRWQELENLKNALKD